MWWTCFQQTRGCNYEIRELRGPWGRKASRVPSSPQVLFAPPPPGIPSLSKELLTPPVTSLCPTPPHPLDSHLLQGAAWVSLTYPVNTRTHAHAWQKCVANHHKESYSADLGRCLNAAQHLLMRLGFGGTWGNLKSLCVKWNALSEWLWFALRLVRAEKLKNAYHRNYFF